MAAISSGSSMHPRISIPVDGLLADPPKTCSPWILLSLPPPLFVDPWQPVSDAPHLLIGEPRYLSAGHKSKVELEQPVGWSRPRPTMRGSKAKVQAAEAAQAEAEASRLSALPAETSTKVSFVAGEGYVTETAVIPPTPTGKADRGKRRPDAENEAVLLHLRPLEANSHSRPPSMKIPLQTRYLPPLEIESSREELDTTSTTGQWASDLAELWGHLTGRGGGNYARVTVPRVEAFLACSGHNVKAIEDRMAGKSGGSGDQNGQEQWEKVIRPSSLLPSTHIHLTSPLISELGSSSSSLSLYRRVDVASTPASHLTVTLPRADANLAAITLGVTQSLVWILALWAMARVWRLTK